MMVMTMTTMILMMVVTTNHDDRGDHGDGDADVTQNVSAPYNNVGAFEMVWTPLPGPEEEDAGKEMMDVETEDDLLGKPWTYR